MVIITKKLFYYFLGSRALVLFFAFLAQFYIPLRVGYLGEIVWSNFDGRHFLEIANIGYQRFNFVYSPLYPFLIFLINKIFTVPTVYVGIGISLLALFFGIWFFDRLAKFDFKQKLINISLLAIVLFPTTFFYNTVYSVSLLFLLYILSFLMARKKKWFWASILAGLSTASHITALSIVPALLTEWILQKRKLIKSVPYLAVSVSGIVAYMIYLQVKFGNWLLFMKSYSGWHRQTITFPLKVPFRYLKIFTSVSPTLEVYWIAVLEFITFIVLLYLAIIVWKKIRISYSVLMLSTLLISSLSGSYIGVPKYAVFMFPTFMGISWIVSKNKKLRNILFSLFIILEFILTGLFVRGYFVA